MTLILLNKTTINSVWNIQCVGPKFCGSNTDPNEQANDTEASDSDGNMDSTGQVKHPKFSFNTVRDEQASENEASDSNGNKYSTGQVKDQGFSNQSKRLVGVTSDHGKRPRVVY